MRLHMPLSCNNSRKVEDLNEFNVVVVGLGGQGSILLSQLIADAARIEGYDVQTAETLGMAQRGGSVIGFVRYGKEIYTPMIPEHAAHFMIALEASEALRAIAHVGQSTSVILNTRAKVPLNVVLGQDTYPDAKKIEIFLRSVGAKTYSMDATDLGERAGDSKTSNVAMLGGMAALGNTGVLVENYRIALKKNLPEKLLHQNLCAFKLGHDAVTALLATN